jgi:SET domain
MVGFNSCPIPYMTPRAFEVACDPSDQLIHEKNLPIETTEVGTGGQHPFFIASKYIRTTPSLWTREPWCIFSTALAKEICVYTSEHFAKGRGISFVLDPDEVSDILQSPVLADVNFDWPQHVNPDLWSDSRMKQEDFPGKGRGMKALQTMYRGDTVQSYTPVLAVADDVMQITLGAFEQNMPLRVAVARLPPHSSQVFHDLWGQFGGDPYYDKINTNAFNAGIGTSDVAFWSVYPESARYNHDCRPNTMYSIESDDLLHNLRVGRSIFPGEEITLSYLAPNLKYQERTIRMESQWGFNCTCALCSAPAHVRAASDDRLTLMEELELELNDLKPNRTATRDTAELLIELHKQERLDGVIGDAYMYAAFENAYLGKKRKVQLYASKAIDHMAVWRGTSHQYFQAMVRLLYEPEREKSWMYFEKLKATEATEATKATEAMEEISGNE